MYTLQTYDGVTGESQGNVIEEFDDKDSAVERCKRLNAKVIEKQLTSFFRVIYKKSAEMIIEDRTAKRENIINWEDSVVDWQLHKTFKMSGRCFVCGKVFSRDESILMGIGPDCGGWKYTKNFDKNKIIIDWSVVAQKMIDRGYFRRISEAHNLEVLDLEYLGEAGPKSIMVRSKSRNRKFTLPKKGVIFAHGELWIAGWVTKIYWR